MKLVVGLGNPGKKYQRTRHNLGFLVIDRLAKQNELTVKQKVGDALVGEFERNGEKIVLAKPQTFMNRSGLAVIELLGKYRGTAEDLLVVYDDLDLPFGRIRIRPQGSAGGHGGIKSILECLAGAPFCRVRVGIGRPPENVDPVDYVLEPFNTAESSELSEKIDRAAAAVEGILGDGIKRAMERFNRPQ